MALLALMTGCGAEVDVKVSVTAGGRGSVTVTVVFPAATAAQLEDLRTGLPTGDLRRSGWKVSGSSTVNGGETRVIASHSFASLSQLPVLMADIAGEGPPASRPFRLSVARSTSTFTNTFTVHGRVDLTCGLACFNDPALARNVGYPLGLAPAQVDQLLGPDPARHLRFKLQLSLPGQVQRAPGAQPVRGTSTILTWSAPLGRDTPIEAVSQSRDEQTVHEVEVAAVALVLLAASLLVLAGRRRARRRRRRREAHRRRARQDHARQDAVRQPRAKRSTAPRKEHKGRCPTPQLW